MHFWSRLDHMFQELFPESSSDELTENTRNKNILKTPKKTLRSSSPKRHGK